MPKGEARTNTRRGKRADIREKPNAALAAAAEAVTVGADGHYQPAAAETLPPETERAIVPDHDKIARLAYLHWEQRGRLDGSAEEDWFKAESELREVAAR